MTATFSSINLSSVMSTLALYDLHALLWTSSIDIISKLLVICDALESDMHVVVSVGDCACSFHCAALPRSCVFFAPVAAWLGRPLGLGAV